MTHPTPVRPSLAHNIQAHTHTKTQRTRNTHNHQVAVIADASAPAADANDATAAAASDCSGPFCGVISFKNSISQVCVHCVCDRVFITWGCKGDMGPVCACMICIDLKSNSTHAHTHTNDDDAIAHTANHPVL